MSDPYEVPINPDLILKTSKESEADGLSRVLKFLAENGYVLHAK